MPPWLRFSCGAAHSRYETSALSRSLRVTIQLPLYNELYVAERVIRSACEVDYPRDRLEIQVLDDSTDQTLELTPRV